MYLGALPDRATPSVREGRSVSVPDTDIWRCNGHATRLGRGPGRANPWNLDEYVDSCLGLAARTCCLICSQW
jgi:hypothetical protein